MAGPQTERLFQDAPAEVFKLAARIEEGDPLETAPLQSVPLEDRYGDEINLLYHAFSTGNVAAVKALLQAGANPRAVDKPKAGSNRDLVYFLSLPGGNLIDRDGLDSILKTFLSLYPDPNVRLVASPRETLAAALALYRLDTGLDIMLAAGADPWLDALDEPGRNVVTNLVSGPNKDYARIDRMIDQGLFDGRSQQEIATFMQWIGGYAQRGDERSQTIQMLAMRVLKRNPGFNPPDGNEGVWRIFKDHHTDPNATEIPWDVINSDKVR